MKKNTPPNPSPSTILEHIEFITFKAKESGLNDTVFQAVQDSTKKIADFLGCQPREAFFLAVVFSINFGNNSVDIGDLSSFFGCLPISVLKYNQDFENLIKLRLLRKDTDDSRRRRRSSPDRINFINVYVPKDILVAVSDGIRPEKSKKSVVSISVYEFLSLINDKVVERDNEIITYKELMEEVHFLMKHNSKIPLIRQLIQLKLDDDSLILLLYVISEFVNYEPTVDMVRTLRGIFPETDTQMIIRREFMAGDNELQHKNLMKLTDSTFKSDKSVELTDKGIDLLVPDKQLYVRKENKRMDIIYAKDIKEKEMYFNPDLSKSLDFLTDSLKPENYKAITARLKDQGLNDGFTVLFHGYPGTGKTSCVYNKISRQTGRNIYMVSISQSKSYFFGSSEKIIKNIFDDYHKIVESSDIAPILLFNECDGIFGSRKTIGHSSVDQTENAIQNIILQEMEVFKGVLIATTNLTKNLDKAFERRFLYKIFFDKPDLRSRTFIWFDRLPFLNNQEILDLAWSFEMSGGQIDNICKKVVMKQVLTGTKPSLQEIQGFCKEEFLEQTSERRKIGFIQ